MTTYERITGAADTIVPKTAGKVRDESPRLVVELVRTEHKLAELREEWNGLVVRANATVYQTHEWLSLWWKHFGADPARELHVLVVRFNGEIAGILPFFLETRYMFGLRVHKSLRLLGGAVRNQSSRRAFAETSPSDFLDVISLPGHRSMIADAFLRYLGRHPRLADEVRMENISDDSVAMNEFLPRLRASGIRHSLRQSDICPRLAPVEPAEKYLSTVRPSVRRKLLHARTVFTSHDGYAIESITSPRAIPEALQDIMELHQRRWNGLGYPGLFLHQRFQSFHADVSSAFLANGWLWFRTVTWRGVRIAARMGFNFHGKMYDYVSGFDECSLWAKHRPGLALLLSMIEDAAAQGCQSVEFLRGREAYKFDLTADYIRNWSLRWKPADEPAGLRGAVCGLLFLLDWMLTRLSAEWMLLQIHYRTHGMRLCVQRYAGFRIRRLKEKLAAAEGGEPHE